MFIEYFARPIIYSKILLWHKDSYIFGLDFKKLVFVVTKWCQVVTMSIVVSLAFEKCVMSLCLSFCLRQFCSALFGLFCFVPVFVEGDKVVQRL
jgi:hypothetical protein